MSRKQNKIAVVGLACKYPDADNHEQLWENILSKRRAFRNMPEERLSRDYFSTDSNNPDSIYTNKVAVLKNYVFDRAKFKISKDNFLTADLAHWLALDVANEALQNANLQNITKEVRKQTAVFLGNTLTGEFSRANVLRIRWPYFAKTIASKLHEDKWENDAIAEFLNSLEPKFKSAFPEMIEDSLAGGLSNTIAGRICNYFDFNGGGYTLDGACSSSLLAVCNACTEIEKGEIEVALAGGVDLSLDPFELVGFSRTGALAKNEMLVYDKNSNGFWPGEGCGFVVLTSLDFAKKNNLNILSIIKGWGISSDGQGGLTRPESDGQLISFERAYKKAGYDFNTLNYVEGHGTGTAVGDATEITTVLKAINASAKNENTHIHLGSIKANIGHTKAAAGIAGLIKSILVVQNRILPPASGSKNQHQLIDENVTVTLDQDAILFQQKNPLRASVSAMGFGGINTHITIEEFKTHTKNKFSPKEKLLLSSAQDTELFLISSATINGLIEQLNQLKKFADRISFAELSDLSFALFKNLQPEKYRIAIEADRPDKLLQKTISVLEKISANSENEITDTKSGIYFSGNHINKNLRIGYLFPGQGIKYLTDTTFINRRFPFVNADKLSGLHFENHEINSTLVAQPSIINASVIALKLLNKLKVKASVGIGHSLGELSALHWADVMDEKSVLEIAKERGRLMHESKNTKGKMLSVGMDSSSLKTLMNGHEVELAIAGINGPRQTVVSGSAKAIDSFKSNLDRQGIASLQLNVENAFHSPLMMDVQKSFSDYLTQFQFKNPTKKIISTVTSTTIESGEEVIPNLIHQLTSPVKFYDAVISADSKIDLWIEVGSGATLENLVKATSNKPAVSIDLNNHGVKGLLNVAGILFSKGVKLNLDLLFENRFYRDFPLDKELSFLINPCESVKPFDELTSVLLSKPKLEIADEKKSENKSVGIDLTNIQSLFIQAVADKLELPVESVLPQNRMLDDLHFNSLAVGQLIGKFADKYNIPITQVPTEYSNASINEISEMLSQNASDSSLQNVNINKETSWAGISTWVKHFKISKKEKIFSRKNFDINSLISKWQVLSTGENILSSNDIEALKNINGNGILISLFKTNEKEVIQILAETMLKLKNDSSISNIVLVQDSTYASGFFKSYFLENRNKKVIIIHAAKFVPDVEVIQQELLQDRNFSEVFYNEDGKRFVSFLEPVQPSKRNKTIISEKDIVLVSGGGKGITAECVSELALACNAKFILLGRSNPENDKTLNENLNRFKKSEIDFQYYQADITDETSLKNTIEKIISEHGTISGFIHGAGINNPIRTTDVTIDSIEKTLNPKVHGFRNVMNLLDKDKLKFILSFGSIIGESGMNGNAEYGLANEWMNNEFEKLYLEYPKCKIQNIEWSVWSGTGMGENLGALENLLRQGITPISLDNGIKVFMDFFETKLDFANVIVSGRYGNLPTLNKIEKEIPILRFIQEIKINYPFIELIAEFNLSTQTDLYLADHEVDGQLIFPAVFGLEAMSQAAFALTGRRKFSFTNVEFLNPIIIPQNDIERVRVIAQSINESTVQVALRCESTSFKMDHFKAEINFSDSEKANEINFIPPESFIKPSINVDNDLYENILFHKGMYKVINSYFHLTPYQCVVSSSFDRNTFYFNDFSPQELILKNPVIRDSALHAVQACVPDYTLLPISFGQLEIFEDQLFDEVIIEATELNRSHDVFTYNLITKSTDGKVLEIIRDAKFKILKSIKPNYSVFNFALNVLQRKVDELVGEKNLIEIKIDKENASFPKRPDGKPLLENGFFISRSHCDDYTLTVHSKSINGCDIEKVNSAFSVSEWKKLLGDENYKLAIYLSSECKEEISTSSTRVWSAIECIRKSGNSVQSALKFISQQNNGIVIFEAEQNKIISYSCDSKELNAKTVFSVLI